MNAALSKLLVPSCKKSSNLVPLLFSCVSGDIKQIKTLTHPISTSTTKNRIRKSEKSSVRGKEADMGCWGGVFRGG